MLKVKMLNFETLGELSLRAQSWNFGTFFMVGRFEDIQQTIPLEVNKIPEAVVEVEKPSDQLETQSQSNQHGKNVFKIHILTKKLPQKNFSILGIEIRLYIYIVCTCVCLDRSF